MVYSLKQAWNNRQFTTGTQVHVYRALVMSILLYASEIRTLLAADIIRRLLPATLLDITWRDHITNEAILVTTGSTPLQDILSKRKKITVRSCHSTQPTCACTRSPTDAGRPLYWSEARRQMATYTRSLAKDLVLPDLD